MKLNKVTRKPKPKKLVLVLEILSKPFVLFVLGSLVFTPIASSLNKARTDYEFKVAQEEYRKKIIKEISARIEFCLSENWGSRTLAVENFSQERLKLAISAPNSENVFFYEFKDRNLSSLLLELSYLIKNDSFSSRIKDVISINRNLIKSLEKDKWSRTDKHINYTNLESLELLFSEITKPYE